MKTEELIAALSAEAGPVPPLPSVRRRFGRWLLLSLPVVAAFVAVAGARPDLVERLADPAFALGLAGVAGLALVSAAVALGTTVPDDRGSRLSLVVPVCLAAAWGGWLFLRLAAGEGIVAGLSADPRQAACALQIVLVALVPAVLLLREARAGASVVPMWTGTLVLGAAASAGATGAAIHCPIDQSAHQILWHFLPVVALAALGVTAGRRWLDRFARGERGEGGQVLN